MATAYLIPALGGEIETLDVTLEDSLAPVYELVCPGEHPMAQLVTIHNRNTYVADLWIDEEGKGKSLPVNPVASGLARAARAIFYDDVIAGAALLIPVEGEDPKWMLDFLQAELRIVKAAAGL